MPNYQGCTLHACTHNQALYQLNRSIYHCMRARDNQMMSTSFEKESCQYILETKSVYPMVGFEARFQCAIENEQKHARITNTSST